jgi:hypothetical protein
VILSAIIWRKKETGQKWAQKYTVGGWVVLLVFSRKIAVFFFTYLQKNREGFLIISSGMYCDAYNFIHEIFLFLVPLLNLSENLSKVCFPPVQYLYFIISIIILFCFVFPCFCFTSFFCFTSKTTTILHLEVSMRLQHVSLAAAFFQNPDTASGCCEV